MTDDSMRANPDGTHEHAPVACMNITRAGERRRRLGGTAALLAGLIVVMGLAAREAPPAAYLVTFPFALGAALGLVQARARTCVALAMAGTAEVEGGGVRRLGEAERVAVRSAARRVVWQTLGIAAGVTAMAVVAGALAAGA